MDEKNLISKHQYYKIRLDILIFFCLGFLLIFVQPLNDGYFKNWLISIYGSYKISLYETFLIPVTYVGLIYLIYSSFLIKKYEYLLYFAIFLVIFSRILSLLVAKQMQGEQLLSILRYIWGLLLILIFSNFFSKHQNRHFFIIGLIIGVVVETIGGILKFLLSRGQLRGMFVSGSSCILQIYVILLFFFIIKNNKKYRNILYIFIFFLILGIIVTGSSSAFILLAITLIIGLIKAQIFTLKSTKIYEMLFLVIFIVIIISLIVPKFSIVTIVAEENIIKKRLVSAFELGGTIGYRFFLWDKAIAGFLEHPITGIGSGGFPRQIHFLPQVFYIEVAEVLKKQAHSPHHSILAIACETGIVGLIAYIIWTISLLNICKKALYLSNLKSKDDAGIIITSLLVIALIISEIGGGPGMFFGPLSFVFLGFLLGCIREKTKKGSLNIGLQKMNNN